MANVEVVYAKPEKQWIINVTIDLPARILDVIYQSTILAYCPEIDLDKNKVGIFGEIVALETLLKDNDRVEIYRPLETDPMIKRFARVKQERKRKS